MKGLKMKNFYEWLRLKIEILGFYIIMAVCVLVPISLMVAWAVFMFMLITYNDGCEGEPYEPDPSDQYSP